MSIKHIYFYIIISLSIVSTCFADPNLPYQEGVVLIRFAPKAGNIQQTANEQNQILSALNAGEVKGSYKIVPGLTLVKLPPNLTVEDALVQLKGKNEFLYVEPNWKIRIESKEPNDTYFPNQRGLHQPELGSVKPDADIDAPEAWDYSTGSSDVIVAVIDGGINYTHPKLVPTAFLPAVRLS